MDPLGDPLTTRLIQTGWEFTMEPYPSGQFWFIDDPDHLFGNSSVWTRTRTRSDGPELLLTLALEHPCTVRSHMTKIYVSCQKLHCACYSSVCQPILTSYCSPFAHNISLTKSLVQDTSRGWWNIDAFYPTFFSLPCSSSFPLHWPSLTPFQPVHLTLV